VTGQTEGAADTALENAGLKASPADTTACGSTPSGDVVSQKPGAGTSVQPGSSVAIVVCTGTATTVTVPNVVGHPIGSAEATQKGSTLVAAPDPKTCSSANAFVLTQTPSANTPVAPDSSVALTCGT